MHNFFDISLFLTLQDPSVHLFVGRLTAVYRSLCNISEIPLKPDTLLSGIVDSSLISLLFNQLLNEIPDESVIPQESICSGASTDVLHRYLKLLSSLPCMPYSLTMNFRY